MRANYPSEFFTCVVSYENTGKKSDFIPPNCWGAAGLLAVDADNEDELREILKTGFDFLELKIVEIENIKLVNSPEEIENIDDHLADNVRNWESGKRWVIGTVHGYYGEGEA